MKRICIVGSGGAGKSTLAAQLGEKLRLPVHHLDRYYWKPGWVETPREEWVKIQEKLMAEDSWIIDGNYGATMELRMAVADTVIFMDFSRWRCLWNVLKRFIRHRGNTRPDVGLGCPERLTWEFMLWLWRFPENSRPSVVERLSRYAAGKKVVTLQSPAEVRAFLGNVASHDA